MLHLINQTPFKCYSKRQATVETATYGSEFVAARIAVEQIMDIQTTMRYLGVPIKRYLVITSLWLLLWRNLSPHSRRDTTHYLIIGFKKQLQLALSSLIRSLKKIMLQTFLASIGDFSKHGLFLNLSFSGKEILQNVRSSFQAQQDRPLGSITAYTIATCLWNRQQIPMTVWLRIMVRISMVPLDLCWPYCTTQYICCTTTRIWWKRIWETNIQMNDRTQSHKFGNRFWFQWSLQPFW